MRAKIPSNKQIQPVDLVAPGFRGLNTTQAGALLSPSYATRATNCVLDSSGRLASRAGFDTITTTPIGAAPTIRTLFEFKKLDDTVVDIVAWNGGIADDLLNPAGNDISGAVVDANGTWKFVNFNSKVLGFQTGQKLIVWNGTGNFATVVESGGTAPSGGVGTAAFGRVWQLSSDLQTVRYSGLLDETDWDMTGDSGQIDMRNIWTDGVDVVTAIEAFNGALIVFGKRHIVVFTDSVGSPLGLDPDTLAVSDVIAGTGTVSQFTIAPVGETDLLFLSRNGVQSIARLIVQKSHPITNLSKYVRDELLGLLQSETVANLRSTYNALTGFYLLSFPTAGVTWVLDHRHRYTDEDGDECSIITQWDAAITALVSTSDNTLYLSKAGGVVAEYTGDSDDGEAYLFAYQSPWLNLGEDFANRLKILKRLGAILFVRNPTTVNFKWYVDFNDNFDLLQTAVSGDAEAEWGEAEFGEDEFSGGLALRILKKPASGRGQYFRIGIEAQVRGEFALQQAELFTKIGRMA
jgi:hypothetical protein